MRLVGEINGEKRIFPLREGSSIIGRSQGCRIVIPVPGISRQHAQCFVDGDTVTIRDLESSHGLYVNGTRVSEAQLKDGDVVGLGQVELRFESGGESEPTLVEATPIEELDEGDSPPGYGDAAGWDEGQGAALGYERAGEDSAAASEGFVEDEVSSEDDTPVDLQFAPQKYEAPEDAAGAGPQLYQRDGHWYLKDPNTGREIEIVPKGAEAAEPGVPEHVAEEESASRIKRAQLMLAGLFILVALVVLAVAANMSRSSSNTTGRSSSALSRDDYFRALHQGIDLLPGPGEDAAVDSEKMDQALHVFALIQNKSPKFNLAQMFLDFTRTLVNEPDNTSKLEGFLREIKRSPYADGKCTTYAERFLNYIDQQGQYEEILNEARDLLQSGKYREALREFRKLDEGSKQRKEARKDIAECMKKIAEEHLEAASRYEIDQKWDETIAELGKAQANTVDEKDKTRIERLLERYSKAKKDQKRIQQARKKFKDGEYDTVVEILKDVGDGPYAKERDELLRKIDSMKRQKERRLRAEQARELYKAGRGRDALRIIDQYIDRREIDMTAPEAERIRTVTQIWEKAEDLRKKEEWVSAVDAYHDLLEREKDEENFYVQQAKSRLDDFESNREDISHALVKKGDEAIKKNNYQEARRYWEQATRLDPNGKLGESQLRNLDTLARKNYLAAMLARAQYSEAQKKGDAELAQKKKSEAVKLFRLVQRMAARGSYHHNDSTKKLIELDEGGDM